jgi:RNA polymerase sigma-70 factor, ECF subfamily
VRRFEAWFDKIVINSCRNRQRRARRWPTTDISDEVALHSGDEFVQTIERDVIRGALESLSLEHQIVVALRFYRDLTVPQIAARLDIPTGTAQSRLHYALRRLQAVMDAADRGQDATEETVR